LLDHCLQCGYVNPKPKEVCPHCSLEMITDKYEDDEFYYCIKCGYKDELHKVSS
jgi:DNA-directed RNA polymerase subunit M/transcription elongation factor TFIIS